MELFIYKETSLGLGKKDDGLFSPRLIGRFYDGLLVGAFHPGGAPEVGRKLFSVFEKGRRTLKIDRKNGQSYAVHLPTFFQNSVIGAPLRYPKNKYPL
jgi:hypothetical protein